MASIFIAYRQSDSKGWAVALRDALAGAFGATEVFIDHDGLEAGPWPDQLRRAVRACRVMLVLIGPGWLGACGSDGRRRLDDPDDVHRREIEWALARPEVAILPLLVDGARAPLEAELPASLAALAAQQAYVWSERADRREVDRNRLVAALERATGLRAATPTAAGSADSSTTPAAAAAFAPFVVALLLTAVVATGFSMASMRLSAIEALVVLAAALVLSYGTRALWRRRRAGGARV